MKRRREGLRKREGEEEKRGRLEIQVLVPDHFRSGGQRKEGRKEGRMCVGRKARYVEKKEGKKEILVDKEERKERKEIMKEKQGNLE